ARRRQATESRPGAGDCARLPGRWWEGVSRIVQSVSDLSSDSGAMEVDRGRAPGGEALALSSAQLGIWFAQKLDPGSAAYNIVEYIEINGPVVLPLFERALRQVVSEAQSLRLQFPEQGGEPRQFVGEPT